MAYESNAKIAAIALPLGDLLVSQGGKQYIKTRELNLYCYITDSYWGEDYFDGVDGLNLTFADGTIADCTYKPTQETENVANLTRSPKIEEIKKWKQGSTGYKRIKISFWANPYVLFEGTISSITIQLHYTVPYLGSGSIKETFAFSKIYSKLNDNLSGSGVCFNTQYGDQTYSFQSFYSHEPEITVYGVDKNNNNRSDFHQGKLRIVTKKLESIYITGYKLSTTDVNYKKNTYKYYIETLNEIGEAEYTQTFYSTGREPPVNDVSQVISVDKDKDIRIKVAIVSPFSSIEVVSEAVTIKCFPDINSIVTISSDITIRPNHYNGLENYKPLIEGYLTTQYDQKYTNYLSFPVEGTLLFKKNKEAEKNIRVSFSKVTDTNYYSLAFLEEEETLKELKNIYSEVSLIFSITDAFENTYDYFSSSDENSKINLKLIEPLIVSSGAFSFLNIQKEDETILYQGKILNRGEEGSFEIDKSKIFIPYLHTTADEIETIEKQFYRSLTEVKVMPASSSFSQINNLSYKTLGNVKDNSSLTETQYCFFGVKIYDSEYAENSTSELVLEKENYLILGRTVTPVFDTESLIFQQGILYYKFIDNGGDENSLYSYDLIADNNINQDTSLSRTYEGKTYQYAMLQITINGTDVYSFTIEQNLYELSILRGFLIENKEQSMDLTSLNLDYDSIEKIQVKLNYYYGFNDQNYITSGNIEDITILAEPVPFGIRKYKLNGTPRGGVKINGIAGSSLKENDEGGIYFVEINALDIKDRIIINYPGNINGEIYCDGNNICFSPNFAITNGDEKLTFSDLVTFIRSLFPQ